MKQVLKKVSLLGVVLILFAINVSAQKTAYEKKVEQIEKQAAQKLGYSQFNYTVALIIMDGAGDAAIGRNTKRAQVAVWYGEEMTKAKSLKTTEDFQKEKQKEEEYKKKQALEEAKRKKEAEENKKIWEVQDKEGAYKVCDFVQIKEKIKDEFEKWAKKGEFEKEADYQERLRTQSQEVFSRICVEKTKERIETLKIVNGGEPIYNAEDEFFTVTFKINGEGRKYYYGKEYYYKGEEWESNINIPIVEAENFKENLKWGRYDIRAPFFDWYFVENYLCPTTIIIKTKYGETIEEYILSSQIKSQSEIIFSFNDLEIENPYLKGFVVNYSKIAREEREKDALEFLKYEEKLDSVFMSFNQQLLQNPYNIDKTTMTDYKKMEREGNREENFKKNAERIKSAYERFNRSFEQELKSKNPEEYLKIFYAQNPDKKATADKLYLDCRCEYKSRMDFDLYLSKNGWRVGYNCDCYEKLYSGRGTASMGVKAYFPDRAEFDKFYEQGEDVVLKEVEKRNIQQNTGNLEYLKQSIVQNKNKAYYSELVDIAIEHNKDLNKEWTKNGQSFASKTEFYEAFVADNYKQILKDKKKK